MRLADDFLELFNSRFCLDLIPIGFFHVFVVLKVLYFSLEVEGTLLDEFSEELYFYIRLDAETYLFNESPACWPVD